jgi:hypothetical protein
MVSKSLAFGVFLALFTVIVAEGSKDHGESCSLIGQLGNFFKSDENDDPNGCNSSKGLICNPISSKCICPPSNIWENSGLLSFIKGGKCVIAANMPCIGKDANCGSNAFCGDETISTCKCKEGYSARDGHCTSDNPLFTLNGSGQKSLNALYIFGLLVSYLMLNH